MVVEKNIQQEIFCKENQINYIAVVTYREAHTVNEGFDTSDCYSLSRTIVRDSGFSLLLEYKACNTCLIAHKEFNVKYA